MSGVQIGFHGKLPSHGDFLQRRVSDAFLNAWDPWLQECLTVSRERLGAEWLQTYLTSPIWRFVLADGVAGSAAHAGVLMPSVDRVGRYFPFTIVAEIPAELPPMAAVIHGRAWFSRLETLALSALDAHDFELEQFDAAILDSIEDLGFAQRVARIVLDEGFPGRSHHWRVPVESSDRVAAALIDPLLAGVSRSLRPLSLWWSDGSDHVGASCLMARALPAPENFVAMLNGHWAEAGWDGDHSELERAAPAPFRYRVASAGVTDVGPVRKINEDGFLDRADLGLWAVADGMGGHSHGAEASQMVTDALASLEPAATVSAALNQANLALERVNADLHRAALRVSDPRQSGTTIVLLGIRQHEWGVLWAGDSRLYVLRDGVLNALTTDHAESVPQSTDPIAGPGDAPGVPSGIITRAVGGHITLVLDHHSGALQSGDRFFLCSDGIHTVIDHAQLTELLGNEPDVRTAAEKIVAAAIAAHTRDNVTALVVDVLPDDSEAQTT
jgi:type VI secretion system ImpM family protein